MSYYCTWMNKSPRSWFRRERRFKTTAKCVSHAGRLQLFHSSWFITFGKLRDGKFRLLTWNYTSVHDWYWFCWNGLNNCVWSYPKKPLIREQTMSCGFLKVKSLEKSSQGLALKPLGWSQAQRLITTKNHMFQKSKESSSWFDRRDRLSWHPVHWGLFYHY